MSDDAETLPNIHAAIRMIQYLVNTANELEPPSLELSLALEDALGHAEAYQKKLASHGS